MNISNFVHQAALEEKRSIVLKKEKLSLSVWLTKRFFNIDKKKYHTYLACQTEIHESEVSYLLNPLDE